MPVRAPMCWARSSARMTCSVKNLEPMVRWGCSVLWQPERKRRLRTGRRFRTERRGRGMVCEREKNLTQSPRRSEHEATEKRSRLALCDFEAALEPAEKEIGGNGEEGGGNGSGQDYGVADHGDSAE